MNINDKIKWIIDRHKETNHFYDKNLPYEFHLNLVYNELVNYIPLVKLTNLFNTEPNVNFHSILKYAAYGHDLIEDARVSYNDVKAVLGYEVAEIVFALTNLKGKTRKDRANDEYYKGITETPGATLIKLCDRLANVKYSMLTKSRMFDMYKKENLNFITKLDIVEDSYLYDACLQAVTDLNNLFK
jgi:(p)ppGpp synthase/HD superfamily hydrolase